MDKISSDKCRQIMLEILGCIHEFCQTNNIRYSLCGGSLLGAIRHKGFIPWDDDIDIMMPRPDYERFIHQFNGYSPNMESFTCGKTENYDSTKTFAKVHDIRTIINEQEKNDNDSYGVFVDIFPIDGISNNLSSFKYQMSLFRQVESIIRISNIDNKHLMSFSAKAKKQIANLLGRSFFCKISHYILTYHPFDKSPFAGVICGSYGLKERLNRETFEEFIPIEFEGKKYSSIKKYDQYLSQIYGNYMELPPIEKRINHSIVAYWK